MLGKFGGLFMIVVMLVLGTACMCTGKIFPAAVCGGIATFAFVMYFGIRS